MPLTVGSAIGLAAFQAGASVAVANAITFGIASTVGRLAFSALSFGVQSYLSSQASNRLGALNNENTGIQQQIRQAIPPQRLVLGTATTSGALFFAKYKAPYTWYGLLLAGHKVGGLDSLYINNTQVFIDQDGFATSVPFRDGSNKYIEVSFRDGDIDQAIDPIIARDFPDMPSTFRQRGHATIVIKRTHGFGSDIAAKNEDHRRVYGDSGVFNPLVRFRGALVHDPRRPESVFSDPSTWAWSDNLVLCLARFMTHAWPDATLFDTARLKWDRWAEAADECDRWETGLDGTTFRRYAASGVVQSTDDPYDVMEALKLGMNGDLVVDAGKIYPVPGAKREPLATFHSGMLIGGFEYQAERPTENMVNIVKTQFVAPDRDFQTVEGPVLRDATAIAEDGAPHEQTITLPFTDNHRRAQRIGYYTKALARKRRSFSPGATLEARGWRVGYPYRVELPGMLARVNGVYKLIGKAWNPDLRGYQLSFIEDAPERFDEAPAYETEFTLDEDTIDAEAA